MGILQLPDGRPADGQDPTDKVVVMETADGNVGVVCPETGASVTFIKSGGFSVEDRFGSVVQSNPLGKLLVKAPGEVIFHAPNVCFYNPVTRETKRVFEVQDANTPAETAVRPG